MLASSLSVVLPRKKTMAKFEPETPASHSKPKKNPLVKIDTSEKVVTRKKNVNHSPYVDRKVEKEKKIVSRKNTENRDNNNKKDVTKVRKENQQKKNTARKQKVKNPAIDEILGSDIPEISKFSELLWFFTLEMCKNTVFLTGTALFDC